MMFLRTRARANRPLGTLMIVLGAGLLTAGAAQAQGFKCPESASAEVGDRLLWEGYGKNLENHRCNETKLRIGKMELEWEITGLGEATSTPVIDGDVAYFGDGNGTLHAVDAEDGTEVWSIGVPTAIRSTPAIDGGVVYFASGKSVYAVDALDGSQLWSTLVDPHPVTLLDSSPRVVEGLVIIGVSNAENFIFPPPYSSRGSVVALDAATGDEIWRVYTQDGVTGTGGGVWSTAAIDVERKMAYVGTGQAYDGIAGELTDALLAINYETGELVWSDQFTEGDVWSFSEGGGPDADIGASPILMTVDGQDVVMAGSKGAIFKILDRDTGALVRDRVLGTSSTLGGVMTSPATDGERVFLANNTWNVFGFFGGIHHPADFSTVMAIDPSTGLDAWTVQMPTPMFGAMTVADGVVFFGLLNGEVYGLDTETGEEVFHAEVAGPLGGGISVARGQVYVPYGFNFASFSTPAAGVASFK
jgi:polyvinyl alcohol dehydrogenase (cytochrome)